ncbi:MAG: hypothetical protein GY870_02500 [archaeon]|nr:hypothetical protein [archaeon]
MKKNKKDVKYWEKYWSKYWNPPTNKIDKLKKALNAEKLLCAALMPVRGPEGFRKLDFEYAKKISVNEIMDKIQEAHFNLFGLVIKDTDGACMWDTKKGWNPTERDLLGEFIDAGKERNVKVLVSFTSMNDAYQGYLHPERISIHGKDGFVKEIDENSKPIKRAYKKGDISTHDEGEMRVDLPEGVTFDEYQKVIPFLQNKIDATIGAARGARGQGYIPTSSFMCPNSEHVDYLVDLAEEVVRNYDVVGIFADYIRYDGKFTDLCCCERCTGKFYERYGKNAKIISSNEWYDFKEDTIATYAEKLCNKVRSIDSDCTTGWFCLPGPPLFTRNRLGQNWSKLGKHFDCVSPMIYPYLTGTRDDGLYWAMIAGLMYKYSIINMKNRLKEYGDQAVFTVTNSVECNVDEMLKQMTTFDFRLGIGIFKYYGTTEAQWKAIKKFAEEQYGLEALGLK